MPTIQGLLPKSKTNVFYSYGREVYINLPARLRGSLPPPRFFNKLMKPVFSFPRELGHISSGYLDDSFSLTILPEERQANIDDTLTLNHDLGFLPYEVKSVTIYTNLGLASRRVYF